MYNKLESIQGSGRGQFVWSEGGRNYENLRQVAGLRAETWTRDLTNTKER